MYVESNILKRKIIILKAFNTFLIDGRKAKSVKEEKSLHNKG